MCRQLVKVISTETETATETEIELEFEFEAAVTKRKKTNQQLVDKVSRVQPKHNCRPDTNRKMF